MSKIRMSYDEMERYFNDYICEVLHEKGSSASLSVIPSFYDTVEHGKKSNGNVWTVEWDDGPVFLGRYRVTEKADAFWSRGEGKDYIGPVLTDPTWKDLMVEAELMIRATKDTHHCFLEIAQVDASDTERLAAIDDGLVLDIIFLMGS